MKKTINIDKELKDVKKIMSEILMETNLSDYISKNKNILSSGKMLRSRLILYLGHNSSSPQILTRAGAAVDIMHSASLIHDDVIDGGFLRRGNKTFWKKYGVSKIFSSI